ncbi:MAG: ABC transporter substrate-binding protein, partial [Bacilli bacterium]
LQDPLLKQLPVRQAMSLAINRQQLYMEGEYGYEPVASPTGLVLPADKSWVDPALPAAAKNFSFNPAAAVKILENAGFKKNANGVFAKNGKPLSFTLQVVSGWTDWDTDCALIAQDLKNIGIQVTVQEEQFGSYFSNINSPKKNYQLAISWTNTGPSPYFLYQNMLNSKGGFNVEQLNSPMIDRTLKSFSSTSNVAMQHKDINILQQYMAQQLPSIPLVFGATWYEYNDANYTGWPSASNPYINPAPFTPVSIGIVLTHLRPRA